MPSSRRDFLAMAGVLWSKARASAQSHAHATAAPAAPYTIAFLSDAEKATVIALADRIVPADERSGGATAARVHEYIDFVLAHAAPELQQIWRDSLRRFEPQARGRSPQQLDTLLSSIAENEFAPVSSDEQFFVLLKSAVVEGFYTSEQGMLKELGYRGNAFLAAFPGCTHSSHEAPPDYKPLLRRRG